MCSCVSSIGKRQHSGKAKVAQTLAGVHRPAYNGGGEYHGNKARKQARRTQLARWQAHDV